VVVVATLPASEYEVAQSEKGQKAFVMLEKWFQRLGADVKPVADDEIYEVVWTWLFESITPESEKDHPKEVAQVYQGMHTANAGEGVPNEAAKNTNRERTCRVLWLLASIVGDLWNRREGNTQTQHIIQPCDVRWSVDALQAALTGLWGPAYQSVVAADVLGEKPNAGSFDEERGGDCRGERLGRSLASTILLGLFGGQGGRSGFSSTYLKLACSRLGLNWNYAVGALLEMENGCFYLCAASARNLGKRYWFGTKPTLDKQVVQYRQQSSGKNFEDEILEDLRTDAAKGVRADYADQLDKDPKADPKKRLDTARRAVLEALGPTSATAFRVRGQEVEVVLLTDARLAFQEHLGYVWVTLVEDEEWTLRRVGSVTLESSGIVPKEGCLRLKDAIEAFLRFTDKAMVSSKEAVTSGVAQACQDALVGRGASVSAFQARYCR